MYSAALKPHSFHILDAGFNHLVNRNGAEIINLYYGSNQIGRRNQTAALDSYNRDPRKSQFRTFRTSTGQTIVRHVKIRILLGQITGIRSGKMIVPGSGWTIRPGAHSEPSRSIPARGG